MRKGNTVIKSKFEAIKQKPKYVFLKKKRQRQMFIIRNFWTFLLYVHLIVIKTTLVNIANVKRRILEETKRGNIILA